MDCHVTAFDIQLVNGDLPEVLTLRRVGWNGITQLYIDAGITKLCLVNAQLFTFQVDAMTGYVHASRLTFHPGFGHEMRGIEGQVGEIQSIDLHLFLEQGP